MAVDAIVVPLAQELYDESPLTLLMDKVSKWENDHIEFIDVDDGLFGFSTEIDICKEDTLDFFSLRDDRPSMYCILLGV